MDSQDWLATHFEAHRPHLQAVAYRMLGSTSEAHDAVQEAWLRLSRSSTDTDAIENPGGWLTTVVSRVCLNMLRTRRTRPEEPLPPAATGAGAGVDAAFPGGSAGLEGGLGAGPADTAAPDDQAVLSDSIGVAMLVVLDTLAPAERLAFVLHDMFAVPFDEIAPIVDRSPAAARQLASRARRRVQGARVESPADPARHRRVVEAFLAAARQGDFDGLLAVLDPDVVLRSDTPTPGGLHIVRGAEAVARGASMFSARARMSEPAIIDGLPGMVVRTDGRIVGALAMGITADRVTTIEIISDPASVAALEVTPL